MNREDEIREEISRKVKDLYRLRTKGFDRFLPGKTPIPYGGRVFDEEEMISLMEASLDFWLTAGRFAAQFERDFPTFLGIKYCSLVNSGSSANLLAVSTLTSRKLGDRRLCPGDEVITPACGFPTTVNPILQNNLVPVFIDVELGSYNIQADQISDAITGKTKALFIPHTLGNPANLDIIMDLVDDQNLWLIEDNCDALGSKFRNRYTGTFGHLSTYSFYPAHHITMGEGGAVVTNEPLLKKIVDSFRDWGRDCWCPPGTDNSCGRRFDWKFANLPHGYDHKYVYSHIGYNLKVTDMQAAVGVQQLKKLPEFIKTRRKNFDLLHRGLEKYSRPLLLPKWLPGSEPSWFGFPILVKGECNIVRDSLVKYLESNLISTRMLFGGNLLKQPAYEGIRCRVWKELTNSDRVLRDVFWIGVYPGLDRRRIEYVLEVFDRFMDSAGVS